MQVGRNKNRSIYWANSTVIIGGDREVSIEEVINK